MPYSRAIRVVAASAAWMLLAGSFAGCNESPQRQASEDILQRVAKAVRLCNQATALLNSPVTRHTATGEYVPFGSDTVDPKPDQLSILGPDEAVNPQAKQAVDKALALLNPQAYDVRDALDRCGPAGKELFYGQRAQALMLDAQIAEIGVGRATRRVAMLMDRGLPALRRARQHAMREQQYRMIAGISDANSVRLLAEAKQTISQTQSRLDKLAAESEKLTAEKDKLNEQVNKRLVAYRRLREQASDAKPEQAEKLLDRAWKQMLEANELASKIAAKENQVEENRLTRQMLQEDLKIAQAVERAMSGAVQRGEQATAEARAQAASASEALDRALNAEGSGLLSTFQTLKVSLAGLADQQQQRLDRLEAAIAAAAEAAEAAEDNTRDDAYSLLGDLAMAKAAVLRSRSEMANRLEAVSRIGFAGIEAPGAADAQKLMGEFGEAYLDATTAAELNEAAAESYSQAVKAYGDALAQVKRQDRKRLWAYQGQQGVAYLGLYRVSGNAEDLQRATELLREATAGKEGSPYLSALVWWAEQLPES